MSITRITSSNLAFGKINYQDYGKVKNTAIAEQLGKDAELNALTKKSTVNVTREFSGAYTIIKKGFLGLFNKSAYVNINEGSYESVAKAVKSLFIKK